MQGHRQHLKSGDVAVYGLEILGERIAEKQIMILGVNILCASFGFNWHYCPQNILFLIVLWISNNKIIK